MANFKDLFGPLGRDYCAWFYFLSILGFLAFLMYAIPALILGIQKREKFSYYFSVLSISSLYLITYFQNRLLHTMCLGSVKV
jgi:hypothetical protein